MTETRLRTYTHLAGYGLATLFIIALASQNLRYGFYELFYLATALALLTGIGAAYTLISGRQQLKAPGHLVILAILNTAIIMALFTLDRIDISYWCLPTILLNMLVLPLRQGLVLSIFSITMLSGYLFANQPVSETLLTTMAMLIVLSAASLYIWHYNHMAQSAEDLAITDPVTGAHNARFLNETLQKEISRSDITNHSLSVILIGIDYVEEAKDLHGESAMQDLSKEVTQQLFEVIRAGDTLYTLGNGEFFLILPFTPEEGVRVIAERIRRTLAEYRWPNIGRLTVSLGCTTRIASDTRGDTLRGRTEKALHQAQKRGHDNIWYSH